DFAYLDASPDERCLLASSDQWAGLVVRARRRDDAHPWRPRKLHPDQVRRFIVDREKAVVVAAFNDEHRRVPRNEQVAGLRVPPVRRLLHRRVPTRDRPAVEVLQARIGHTRPRDCRQHDQQELFAHDTSTARTTGIPRMRRPRAIRLFLNSAIAQGSAVRERPPNESGGPRKAFDDTRFAPKSAQPNPQTAANNVADHVSRRISSGSVW